MIRIAIAAVGVFFCADFAMAGSNQCYGTVEIGKEWTTVKGDLGDFAPEGCRFQTTSKLGKHILATCPNGSNCSIDIPLNQHSSTVKAVTSVRRE